MNKNNWYRIGPVRLGGYSPANLHVSVDERHGRGERRKVLAGEKRRKGPIAHRQRPFGKQAAGYCEDEIVAAV